MPRLFLGNFDFEHRLAEPKRQLPTKLERINAELATSWLAIANDGDYLWTPQPIASSFFEQAVSQGLPNVIPIVSFDKVPRDVECVPWGWTDNVRRLCDKHGWIRNDPPDGVVRAANSRRLSAALEREWRVGLDFSGEVTSLQEIERFIERHEPMSRWVIKAEFGMSGRERIIGSGPLTDAQSHWAQKRLTADGVVFFEPWVERLDEVGIQISIPRAGEPEVIQAVPLLSDGQGQYVGSIFASLEHLTLAQDLMMGNAGVDVALRAARRMQDLGYFGPLGIDVMRYRAADRSIRLRPLQDINARWTMGRLSVGWRRLLKRGESTGRWIHVSAKQIQIEAEFTSVMDRFRDWLKKRSQLPTETLESMAKFILERGENDDTTALIAILETCMGPTSDNSILEALAHLKGERLIREITSVDEYLSRRSQRNPQRNAGRRRTILTSPETVGSEPSVRRSLVIYE